MYSLRWVLPAFGPPVWTSGPDVPQPLSKRVLQSTAFPELASKCRFRRTWASHLIYALLQVSHLVAYLHSCALETQSLWPLPPFLPLQAPHWVTPELGVPSDSGTWLRTLNSSSESFNLLHPPWGCGGMISVVKILAAPAQGTQAYTRPGCLGFGGKAPQREPGEAISSLRQRQGPLTSRNRRSGPQPMAPHPRIPALVLASRLPAFGG